MTRQRAPHHRDFVASVPSGDLASMTETSDRAGLNHLAGHLSAIAALGVWVWAGWPFWPVALVALGVALVFLFALEHEATHATPFRNKVLNEVIGHLCGLVLLLPFTWFRYFHLAHHRWTNIPGKDPELLAGAKPETWREFVWHVSGVPYWTGMIGKIFANSIGASIQDFVPTRAKGRVKREAMLLLAAYAVAGTSLFFSSVLFWVWIVPVLIGQPFLRLYLLAEHGRCAFVDNMLENTRTTYTGRLVRYLAWNMPYHTEHHTLPNVPFHRLPELHQKMEGWHRETSPSYRAFLADYLAGPRFD